MSPDQPRSYKHQLTAEEFIFAFTATAEAFEVRKEEMRGKGVERLTGSEIIKRYNVYVGYNSYELVFTLLAEVEVIAEANQQITLRNIQAPVPSLVLWRSAISAPLILTSCTLARIDDGKIQGGSTAFRLFESTTGYFYIDQSTTGYFFIGQSTTGYFDIRNQSTTGYFDIDQSTTGYFDIDQSITGNFDIRNQSTTGYFFIDQSTTGNFFIDQSTTGNFDIGQSITGYFDIDQSTTGNFFIDQSTTGDFDIDNSEIATFNADGLFSSFYLTKATIAQFRLQDCKLPELRLASGCRIECYIAHSAINLIDLQHLTLSKDSVVSLFDCQVYACLMEEFSVLGNLFFRQIKKAGNSFDWYDANEKSEGNERRQAVLQEHTKGYEKHQKRLTDELRIKQATFRITQSSLGKTEFTDCDLGGFRFEFNNAKITEVFMSGGTVPEKRIVIHGCTEKDTPLAWHEQKVSVYNQLKKIFDGQGDIYWATHFQAKTAEHQEKVLQLRRKDDTEVISTTFWDLWTFRLNRWSNRHGESWGRALLFTLGIAALFYLLFLGSVGRLFQPTAFDWNLAGQYFQFLDPTHKIDFVKDACLNMGSYAADYTGWVFIGYGIFQFIAAFRKHGKRQ